MLHVNLVGDRTSECWVLVCPFYCSEDHKCLMLWAPGPCEGAAAILLAFPITRLTLLTPSYPVGQVGPLDQIHHTARRFQAHMWAATPLPLYVAQATLHVYHMPAATPRALYSSLHVIFMTVRGGG